MRIIVVSSVNEVAQKQMDGMRCDEKTHPLAPMYTAAPYSGGMGAGEVKRQTVSWGKGEVMGVGRVNSALVGVTCVNAVSRGAPGTTIPNILKYKV